MQTISSQRYIDDATVAAKAAAADFEVFVSPAFEFDGEVVRVVLDGHHSLAAAKLAGVAPVYVEYTATEHDAIALLEAGAYEDFLMATHLGDDYYNVETGMCVW